MKAKQWYHRWAMFIVLVALGLSFEGWTLTRTPGAPFVLGGRQYLDELVVDGAANIDGGVAVNQASGNNALGVLTNGARVDFGAGANDYVSSDGTTVTFAGPIHSSSTSTAGTITLNTGSGTATVTASTRCVCTDTTANASVKCALSGTTLTATGTGSDVIAYICL